MAYSSMFAGAGGGAAGFIPGLMSGLFPDPAQGAMPYLSQIPGQISPYFQPYIQTGQQELPGLQQNYAQMLSNPNAIISRLGAGYKQSPGYQWQLGQGEAAINNAQAAGGMAGTPQHQQLAAQLAQNLANQDYQQYLQQALGLYGGGLQGASGLASLGEQSGRNYAEDIAAALMSQGNLAFAGQANQNQQTGGLIGNILGLFSGGGNGKGGTNFFGL